MFSLPLNQRKRCILHIDADAFFASVEQVLNPTLKGKPIMVGAEENDNHGIVSAASYEAKACGIKTGMPMYQAKRLCPKGICVKGNFDAYRDFSKRMYQIFLKYTPAVEMASIDEAYLDVSGCEQMHKMGAADIARALLFDVYRSLGISVSCGLASNKTVAKVACSVNKPHKLTIIPYGKEREFLSPLPLRALPGIGPRTFEVLERFGYKTLGDFNSLNINEMIEKFTVNMIPLWKRACGIDNSPVVFIPSLPKSISKEHTFYSAPTENQLMKVLKEMSVIVLSKLRAHQLKARTIVIKNRYKRAAGGHPFLNYNFQRHLLRPSCCDSDVFPQMQKLFLENRESSEDFRLVGVGVCGLIKDYNLDLFERDHEKEKLFYSIDNMKKLYGEKAISYGV
ncbi:DNA polymerase IV [Patescibacteria group bacterium]|nr:DNA polymerase IV [Patescibacteria group bacterium]